LRLLTAFCLFTLTVLQGLTFCLCAPDPDTCGEQCHGCASLPEPDDTSIKHVCEHLDIAALPPGRAASNLLDELLAALFLVSGFRSPTPDFQTLTPDFFLAGRPPDVPPSHLIYLARSAQILC
jgi:hypothetical protein